MQMKDSSNKDFLLKESKNFCMLPWVHLHLWPDGKAFPCCVANGSMPVGTLKHKNLTQIWNESGLRKIRTQMLNDQPSKECRRCYYLESVNAGPSHRQNANQRFAKHWSQVQSTQENGFVPKVMMAELDIRFSNLCNFRCLSCGPHLSSAWYEEAQAIGLHDSPKKILDLLEGPSGEKFWKELELQLLKVDHATFAGGEPLLCETHFRIMDFWIAQQKLDVEIYFISNFSELNFRGRHVFEYWRQFPQTTVAASLDDSGLRAEYLRKGTQWSKIVLNRKRMLKEVPNIAFEITPTISLCNVEHFLEFHWEWIEEGLIDPNAIKLNLLSYPEWMNLRILEESKRLKIAEKYRLALQRIKHQCEKLSLAYDRCEAAYLSVIQVLEMKALPAEQRTLQVQRFKKRINELDQLRSDNFAQTFPELIDL